MRRQMIPLVALLAACSTVPSSPRSGDARLQVGESSLHLELSVSRETIRAGEPDTIRVRLTNDGPAAATLHFSSGCQIVPYIRNGAGTVVLPEGGGWMCTAALTQLTVNAGQSVVREFVWAGSTGFASEMPTRSLPPGTYYVTAEARASEGTLRTTPVTITLQNAAP